MRSQPTMEPMDTYNRALLDNVHPAQWTNPSPTERYNVVILGGGTAGLITAVVAASMGARTALVERHFMGGDCLNVGCVPSKGLIRGARAAAERSWQVRNGLLTTAGGGPGAAGHSAAAGGDPATGGPTDSAGAASGASGGEIDFSAVMERLRRIRSEISGHDSAARYRDEFGVDVYIGSGAFTGPRGMRVTGDDGDTRELTFSRAVIATGARAAAPPIPGLDTVAYLTNETLFGLTTLPESIVMIGAGPIGCEMAQSFARLGSRVELVEMAPRVLPREDPDTAEIVQAELVAAGVQLHLGAAVKRVDPAKGAVATPGGGGAAGASESDAATGSSDLPSAATVTYQSSADENAAPVEVSGERLLVAIGRAANIQGIGLEDAGVRVHPRGVEVNAYLQTSNRRIYAAGDVASPYQFTHMAEAAAGIVIQNALFARTARFDRLIVPWSTYTSPEVAHVGLSESAAARDNVPVDVYRHEMSAVDRAQLDGETDGFVKILTKRGTKKIVGCTIVAAHAGEMIAEVVLAMQNGIGIDKLAGVIHPYPTQSEAVKRAATGYLRNKLTPRAHSLMGRWFRMRR